MIKQKKQENDSMRVSKIGIWMFVSLVFAVLLAISLFTKGYTEMPWNKQQIINPGQPINPGQQVPTQPDNFMEMIDLNNANSIGDTNARVVIIEYSDFQCPFCQRFYYDTEKQLIQNYVETGEVRLVYKHFPLDSIHKEATPAALASECAAEQGKFWEYHDKLFVNMQSLNTANYKAWAKELGLDEKKFNDCFDSQKYLNKVKAEFQEGVNIGVTGTPSFVVSGPGIPDGEGLVGAQPLAAFEDVIRRAKG